MADLTRRRLALSSPAPEPPTAEPVDGLKWWVFPHDRSHARHEMDLSEFAKGNADNDVAPRPELIADLASAIAEWSIGKPKDSAQTALTAMRTFWRFADTMTARTGGDVVRLADITHGMGQLFKGYLIRDLKLGPSAARTRLKLVQRFAENARDKAGEQSPRLLWPSIKDQKGADHRDVDPILLRRLYAALKDVQRLQDDLVLEGASLNAMGHDPRELGPRAPHVYSKGSVGGRKNPANADLDRAWRKPENIAFLTKRFVDAALVDPGTTVINVCSKRYQTPELYGDELILPGALTGTDVTPFDRLRWFVPTYDDTFVAMALVLLHTGWNLGTVLNIDIESWHEKRIGSELGETVAVHTKLFGVKGRTGEEQVSFSLTRPKFHPYRVIEDQISRTLPLRAALGAQVAGLEAKPHRTHEEERSLEQMRRSLKSPWLFFRNANLGIGGRVGDLRVSDEKIMNQRIRSILREHGERLGWLTDEALAAQINELRLSDLRDGFAAFLYEDSLYNMFLVKRALGHKSLSATKHYLRQKRQRRAHWAEFKSLQEAIWDEIATWKRLDPTILFIRVRYGDATPEQRRRLAEHRERTRMGMGCLDPRSPPPEVAPNHKGGTCIVQRCTLCRHGVVFEETFEALALRMAEIRHIRPQIPPDRWGDSSFVVEWAAIEETIERSFPGRQQEFEDAVEAFLARIRKDEIYVFEMSGAGSLR
jgi:hypothetical protein